MCGSDLCAGGPALRRVGAGLAALLLAGSALAQPAPSREQEQIRRLRLQVQQLQQAQSSQAAASALALQQAQAGQAALQQQLAAAQPELRRLRARQADQALALAEGAQALQALQAQRQERAALDARLAGQASELTAAQQELAQQKKALQDALRLADQRALALADLQARHGSQAQGLQACLASNQALHGLGLDLLQRYADKTVAEVLAENEPFVQTRRVALENLMQGYRDKLDAQALRTLPEAARAP
jgi:chromosome segregation ATPase